MQCLSVLIEQGVHIPLLFTHADDPGESQWFASVAQLAAAHGIRAVTPDSGEVKIGQGTEWSEIVGCGMVHPNILRMCGLDPDEWQGFAFGFGIDRLGRLKYGMPDLRDMFASDVRWLDHYGFSAFQAPNPASGLS